MAGGHRFTSQEGMTLSKDWLCQKWDPGHPEHPLLLSDAVVNLELKLYKGQKTHSLRMLENLSIDLCLFINK